MTREHCLNPLPSRQEAVKLNAEYMFVCFVCFESNRKHVTGILGHLF